MKNKLSGFGCMRFVMLMVILGGSLTLDSPAQEVTGTIFGKVTDPTGAVLPGVEVTITNLSTGVARTAVTDDTGSYLVSRLTPGMYAVRASLTGFKTFEQKGIKLEVRENARVDVKLEVGEISEVVSVTGEAPMVETRSAEVGGVETGQRIVGLPLNVRDPYTFVFLQPNVTSFRSASGEGTQFSIGGTRGTDTNVLLEGAVNVDPAANFQNFTPNPDAVQEFRVQRSTYDAEFGRGAGGQINVALKSGTNNLHGSVWEFHRNDAVRAKSFFENRQGSPKPKLLRHQFGGTFGGPIIRDKHFFFGSYEGFRQVVDTFFNALTPQGTATTGPRVGDFRDIPPAQRPLGPNGTALLNSGAGNCRFGLVPNPFKTIPGTPGDGFIDCIDPVAVNLIRRFIPTANSDEPGNPIFGRHRALGRNRLRRDQLIVKTDHNFLSKHVLTLNYDFQNNKTIDATHFGFPASSFPGFGQTGRSRSQVLSPRLTSSFSPTMINEFQLALNRLTVNSVVPANRTKLSELGITGITPTFRDVEGPTAIALSGLFGLGNSIQGPQFRSDNVFQWRDTFSYQRGQHQMKWGASVERFQQNQPKFTFENNGLWFFIGPPLGTGPGGPYASFLGGSGFGYEQTAAFNIYIRHTTMGYFFNDTWRAHDRITLNFGIRYEIFYPQVEKFNRVNNYKPGSRSTVFPTAPPNLVFPNDPGIPRGLTNTALNNWGPKFGIAWDVLGNGKLAVRSGFGIYYSVPQSELQLQFLLAQPFAFQRTLGRAFGGIPNPAPPGWPQGLANNFSAPGSLGDPFRLQNGFRSPFPFTPGRPGTNAIFETPISATVLDPGFEFKIPYVQQYNLNVQWEFRPNYVLEVAYIGSQGRKLLGRNVVNYPIYTRTPDNRILFPFGEDNPDPNFSNITVQQTFSNSYYNALSIAVNKRFSQGFDVRSSYTFAKAEDNLSSLRGATIQDPTRPELDRGRSSYDVRHRFVSSGVWDLPFGSGRRFLNVSGLLDKLIGGWEINYIWTAQTGTPLNLTTQTPTDGALGVGNTRPDLVGDRFAGIDRNAPVQRRGLDNPSPSNPNARPYFNNGRITGVPPAFAPCTTNPDVSPCFGNLGRNTFTGPGFYNIDFVVGKKTRVPRINENFNVEFRAEFFNLLNRPNFANPNTTVGSPTFGLIRSTADARIVQFGLRIGF